MKLTPADESETGPHIKETTLINIPANELHVPDVTYKDFISSL